MEEKERGGGRKEREEVKGKRKKERAKGGGEMQRNDPLCMRTTGVAKPVPASAVLRGGIFYSADLYHHGQMIPI